MISLMLALAFAASDAPPEPGKPAPPEPSLNYYAYGWAEMPTPMAVDSSRPGGALTGRRAASVSLFCSLTAEGRLSDCQATEETPAGKGFAGAALKLAGRYRMNLPGDGRPIAGETVRFVIAWEGPSAPAPSSGWSRGRNPGSQYTRPRITMPTARPASVP